MTLWQIRATVDDRPGYLAVLAASLALRSVNILSVQVHTAEGGAIDDFLVDAPDALSEEDLRAAVVKGRGRDAWVRRADAHGLVDASTALLGLAGRLVRDPDDLGAVLAALLGECAVQWRPEPCPARAGFTATTITLPDPAGGTLRMERAAPPFTPAEYARAHAMVDLASAIQQQAMAQWQLLLPGGAELTVRVAGIEDLEAVAGLHARCSPGALRRRYLCGTAGPGRMPLERLLRSGVTLIVLDRPGGLGEPVAVGMANLMWEGAEAEIGLLVADEWQGAGVGTALLRRLVGIAVASGIEAVHAHTDADNRRMIRTMRRMGRPLSQVTDGPVMTMTMDLRPAAVSPADRVGTGSPSRAR